MLGRVAGGAQGRAAAPRSVAESRPVFQRQFNQAFVLMQYLGYLRRGPDAATDADFGGYRFWLDELNEFGGDYIRAEMVKAFITSLEYQQRFGPADFDLSKWTRRPSRTHARTGTFPAPAA